MAKKFSHTINTLDHHSEISIEFRDEGVHEHRTLKYEQSRNESEKSNVPFNAVSGAADMAQQLYEKYQSSGKVTLTLSGGIDSQAMLFAFIESGVPFRVAVMQFKNRMNEHDIGHSLDLLASLGIKPLIYELDIESFYKSGRFMDYVQAGHTNSPQFAAHIWLAEQIDGIPVFAGEPWHRIYETVEAPKNISALPFYFPRYKEYGAEIALKKQNRICVSHFFETSIEWFQSVAAAHPIHRYSNEFDPVGTYRAKYQFYRRLGFPVSLTSGMSKLTGFERLYALTAIENNSEDYYYFNKIYREPLEKVSPPPATRTIYAEGLSGSFWDDMRSLQLSSQKSK